MKLLNGGASYKRWGTCGINCLKSLAAYWAEPDPLRCHYNTAEAVSFREQCRDYLRK
jgi:hypothetical protein